VASNETGHLLNEIGQLLAEDTEYPLDGTLLHAALGANSIAPSIFKNRGNHVLYRRPDLNRLGELLLNLWEAEEPGKRWAEMEYVIRGGKFEAIYTYPEEIDRKVDSLERRKRIVKRHFGDKPIVYPPWPPPDDVDGQTFMD
jgi:hypothetical protein